MSEQNEFNNIENNENNIPANNGMNDNINNVTDNNDPSNNNGMNDPVMNGVDMNNPNVNGPVCANNYMGLGPIYPAAYYKEKAKPVYGKAECILSPLIFLFSVLFIRYVVFNVTGLISTLVYAAIMTTVIIYLKKKEYVFSKFNKFMGALLYMFSTVFFVTDNPTIKFFGAVFLFGAGAYFIFSVCSGNTDIDRYLPYALKKSVLDHPFAEFGVQPDILSDSAKNSDTSSNIKRIIGGLVLALPVTIIVGSLLMSADDGMNHLLSGMFDGLYSEELWTLIFQICMSLPCSLYLFGMIYSNVYRRKASGITAVECDEKLRSKRKISNLVFYSGVTPILILYIMFFISQASYFLSAFMGRLPEEFSYAEYARQGFFELCGIVVINLAVMIIMNLHSRNSGEEKTTALKVYNIIFCVFTLILIATAMSKMMMYIDAYGLTTLRVYTTWFMILCTFIFLLIFVKQFKPQINMSKILAVGFTLMFAVLCFSRTESFIVKYNCAMRKVTPQNISESGIYSMSDDGLLAAVNTGLMTAQDAKYYSIERHDDHFTDDLNVSTMIIHRKYMDYMKEHRND